MLKNICKIILVRHGSTIYSEQERLYDGEEYPPLNQQGRMEMELLSKWLYDRTPHVDAIYTSSSLRSIQSARYLSKEYDIDYIIGEGLYERKAGLWAGLTFEQIEKKYPDMLKQYHENPYNYWPEGGETTQEVRKRVEQSINALIKENEYKTIILITHKSVIQSAIASILNVSENSQGKILIPTGSASQLNYYNYDIATLAYSAHVPK